MLFALTLGFALSLGASAEPVKLALPGLNFVKVDKEVAGFFSEHLAQKLTFEGLKVTSSADIAAVLGFERQKALLGCSDAAASDCMIELANALGVDGIVAGSVGKFGETYQLNLKVISASDGTVLCANSAAAQSETEVLAKIDLAAASFARQLLARFQRGRFVPSAGPLADAVRLASPGLKITRVDPKTAAFLEEHFQQQLIFNKALLLTPRDIAQQLGQERQKALMGCTSDKCQTDLSTQLKADGVLTGQITTLGGGFRFDFKVLGNGGEALGIASVLAKSQPEALEVLKGAAKELAQQVRQAVAGKRREEEARAKAEAQAAEKRQREEEARAKAEAQAAEKKQREEQARAKAEAQAAQKLRRDEEARAKAEALAAEKPPRDDEARARAGASAALSGVGPSGPPSDPVATALAPSPSVRRWPVAPTVVGAILMAAGAGALIGSTQISGDVTCTFDDAGHYVCDGSAAKPALLIGGIAGLSAGAVLIGIAGIVYAARAPAAAQPPLEQSPPPPAPPPPLVPTAAVVPGGFSVGIAGRF